MIVGPGSATSEGHNVAFDIETQRAYDFAQDVSVKILPERSTPVPSIGELASYAGRLTVLEPMYNRWLENDWDPVIQFTPEGLSFVQSNHLLTGHTLASGLVSTGVISSGEKLWSTYQNPMHYEEIQAEDGPPKRIEVRPVRWEVSLTSSSNRPLLTSISPNGSFGIKSREIIKQLRDLLVDPTERDERVLVAKASPSVTAYNLLQLRRLTQGLRPVDPDGDAKSFLKQQIRTVQGDRVAIANWDERRRAVFIGSIRPGLGSVNRVQGIRPSVSVKDLSNRRK